MDTIKWVRRKYPITHEEIAKTFTIEYINKLKDNNYLLGRLNIDIKTMCGQKYGKSTLIIFKRSNPINNPNYPMHYGIVKCVGKDITTSGYHSITIFERDFTQIVD